jgi:hypothetical protein
LMHLGRDLTGTLQTFANFKENWRRTRDELHGPSNDGEECNIFQVRCIEPSLVGGMASFILMQQVWNYMEICFGMPARALRRHKEDLPCHGTVPKGYFKAVRERCKDLAAQKSDMMRIGLAHLWAMQENYDICFKKLSGTERTAWQETRQRLPADNEPREFFIFIIERRIPEPAGEEPPVGRPPELTVLT